MPIQQNSSIPNLISSPSLETTEKSAPTETETQTETPVSVTTKEPHISEPRPFSLVSSTTVKTETTPAAKVSEHTSSSGGLRRNGFYDDVNSLSVISKATSQRERTRFINNNNNSIRNNKNTDENKPRIRNPNRVRFTPPTSTSSYSETEEERLKRIRTFRPNVELDIEDLSSLTAVDFSSRSKDERRRRGRPKGSTTTPLPPTKSSTVSSRNRYRFRQNGNKIENETKEHEQVLEKVPTSESPQQAETPKPFRRNRKIIRRIRPSSFSTTPTIHITTAVAAVTSTIASIKPNLSQTPTLTHIENSTEENLQANSIIEDKSNASTVAAFTEDNETDSNQEREDILKSSEEGENIKLSESVRQESSLNNGITPSDIKRTRKIIKINRHNTSSTTEPGIIIRTRKIIRKLHPTKAPVLKDEEIKSVESTLEGKSNSETSTNVEKTKLQKPSYISRRKPSQISTNLSEPLKTQNESKDVKIVPFTYRRRTDSKYNNVDRKINENIARPQFRQRTTSERTTTTSTIRHPVEESSEIVSSDITTTEVFEQQLFSSTTTETYTTNFELQTETIGTEDETTEFLERNANNNEKETYVNITESMITTTDNQQFVETTTVALENEELTEGLDNMITSTENESTTDYDYKIILPIESKETSTESLNNKPVFTNPFYKPAGSRVSFNIPKRLFNNTNLETDGADRNNSRDYFVRKFQRKQHLTTKPTTESYKVTVSQVNKPQYERKGYKTKYVEDVREKQSETTLELSTPVSLINDSVVDEITTITPTTESYKNTSPFHRSSKTHYEQKRYKFKHVNEQNRTNNVIGNDTLVSTESFDDVQEKKDTTINNLNRYGEEQSERSVSFKPTEDTSLYRNTGYSRYKNNQATTSKIKPSRNFGFRQRSTTASSVQRIKDINVQAISLRNKNLFSKTRKMNIPHPGNYKQNEANSSEQDEENKLSSTAYTTPASLTETTEQQTTLLHVFAVTESLENEEDIKITESPKTISEQSETDSRNKTLQKLIEINRIVEVHGEEKIITNKTENIESKSVETVPVVDKLGVITRVVEIKIVEGNRSKPLDDREERKLDYNGIKINSVQEQPNKIEIIDNKSRVKTITPNPLFSDTSTISLEGLFINAMSHKEVDEEDELLNTQNSNLFKIRLLDQDRSSSSKKIRFDNKANFIPLTILKQDEEKAKVVELPPQNYEERIKIAPVSLLTIEMGDASHRTTDKR